MKVVVSTRNFELTDGLREAVEQRFDRLERFEPRASRADVRLMEEKKQCKVEARVRVDGSGSVHATAQAAEARAAVDRAIDKLARQLKRNHSRRRNHNGRRGGPAPEGRES